MPVSLHHLSVSQCGGEEDRCNVSEVRGSRLGDALLCRERETDGRCVRLLLRCSGLHFCNGNARRPTVSEAHEYNAMDGIFSH